MEFGPKVLDNIWFCSRVHGRVAVVMAHCRCHRAIEKALGEAAASKSLEVLQLTCMSDAEVRQPIYFSGLENE